MYPQTTFGSFLEGGRAYRVNTPFPPREMTNVLYSDDGYYIKLSHYGTSDAEIRFPDGEINTVVADDQKTLYCRDDQSGAVWCPGVFPMMSAVQEFSCEHHDGYSVIRSVADGLAVTWRLFLPLAGAREIWTVTIENRRDRPATVSVVPAALMQLSGFAAPRFYGEQDQYGTCDFDETLNGLFFHAGNPNPKWRRYHAALAASREVSGYCGDSETFLGAPKSFHHPHALLRGPLGKKRGYTGKPFQALQTTLQIAPGQSERVDLTFAVVETREEAVALAGDIRSPAAVDRRFDQTCRELRDRRNRLEIRTPDPQVDSLVNVWMRKGLEYCLWKKAATRDNLQFADGLAMARPDLARRTILTVMGTQLPDGRGVRSWVPMDETHYGDSHLWIVLTTCRYLRFTDDRALLDESVPFLRGGSGTVLEHLERAIDQSHRDRGPHGLPRIHWADWNDALNLADPEAESVYLAMFLGVALREMEALARHLGQTEKADRYRQLHADLKHQVNAVAWDEAGGYYVRAFADGKVIGGSGSEGSKAYINPQSWAILGEMVPAERLPRVLRAIDQVLDTDLGSAVNTPSYDRYDPRLGRISAQLPGTGENGSVYCHVTGFKAAADVTIGRGDGALASLHKIFPDSAANPAERSGATPYALTSCYALNPAIYGRAGRPWLTGTQCWVMRAVVDGLLGVRPEYNGFRIAPAFPSRWDTAEITLQRHRDSYRIRIRRDPKATEPIAIAMNGTRLKGSLVPFQKEGRHEIEVVLPPAS